jgi:hydrogenase/urease accessory protein HupE
MNRRRWLPAVAVALLPATAEAHLVSARFGDFYTGFLHPLTALENLLPWVALGLLGALQPVAVARWLLLAFPAGVAAGVLLATVLPGQSAITGVNMASFVVVGVLVLLAVRLPPVALLGLAGLLGVSHGYDNGLALPPAGNVLLFVGGVATAGYLVVALTAGGATALAVARPWGRIAIRAAGSWITAIGVMVAGLGLLSPA